MKPKILYLLTSNPDKVFEYQKLFELSNTPVIVQSADVILRDFYHAQELSESVEGNVEEKRDVLAEIMSLLKGISLDGKPFRKNKQRHDLIQHIAENVDQLTQQYEDLPVRNAKNLHRFQSSEFFENDIYFAVEDSSIGAPPLLWYDFDKQNLPKETAERIYASLKDAPLSYRHMVEDPRHCLPGVEYAPTCAALGTKEIVRRLHEAAELEGIHPPEVGVYSLLNMTNIKDAEFELEDGKASFKQFRQYAGTSDRYYLDKEPLFSSPHPNGIHAYFRHPNLNVSTPATGEELIGAYKHMIALGSRAPIVKQINKFLFNYEMLPEGQQGFRKELARVRRDDIHAGFLDTDNVSAQLKNHAEQPAFISRPPNIADIFTRSLNFVETSLQNSDLMVLPPVLSRKQDDDKDLKRFVDLYTLNSFITAKMLISRDKPKPVIVQNIVDQITNKGCWDDAVDLHHHLVGNQMCRDANLDPTPWLKEALGKAGVTLPEGVTLQHNDYFTVLTGAAEAVQKVTTALIEYWKPRLVKVNMPGQAEEKEKINTVERDAQFKVGIFLSAGSENDNLLKSTSDFCAELARKNIGIVYGGGDQHLMGAIYEGVKEYADAFAADLAQSEKPVLKAYSTHEILKTESREGDFPSKKERENIQFYGKLCKDIYQRMGDMFADSDMLLFRPGGAGTMQELTAGLIVRKLHPDFAANKPIIICDTKLHAHEQQTFYEAVLNHLFPVGDTKYHRQTMHANVKGREVSYEVLSDYSGEAPIYITHDDATAQALIDLHHQPDVKLQPGHLIRKHEHALQL